MAEQILDQIREVAEGQIVRRAHAAAPIKLGIDSNRLIAGL